MANTEETRRNFNSDFDSSPSLYHKYNYSLIKSYIKNKKVLDVGCWSGQLASLEAQVATSVSGIDPGEEAISFAKKYVKKAKFIVGTAQELPFKSNSFDVVTFCDVIEHLPKGDEIKALEEIYRVLKPNGILLLATPNNNLLSIALDPAYFLLGHRHYSQKHIVYLIKQSGFKIKHKEIKGGIIRLITINTDTVFKHIFRRKINYPKWWMTMLENELKNEGIAGHHIIATKK